MKFVVAFVSFLLVLFLLITGVSFLVHPKDDHLSDEQKVMKIAVDYIEEKYGNDYAINGYVEVGSYTEVRPEGDTVYTDLVASFRVPADYQQSGQYVNVIVNPEKEKIVKVYTHPSKNIPPPSPP